jgi:hypothetical protein
MQGLHECAIFGVFKGRHNSLPEIRGHNDRRDLAVLVNRELHMLGCFKRTQMCSLIRLGYCLMHCYCTTLLRVVIPRSAFRHAATPAHHCRQRGAWARR